VIVMCPAIQVLILAYSCYFSLGEHDAHNLGRRRLVGAPPTGRCPVANDAHTLCSVHQDGTLLCWLGDWRDGCSRVSEPP
jgi:hypothetical protein